jgi:hypothetical protein
MRSTRRLASGALVVAVLATLAGAAGPAAAATGAVPNPSFEDGWRDSKPRLLGSLRQCLGPVDPDPQRAQQICRVCQGQRPCGRSADACHGSNSGVPDRGVRRQRQATAVLAQSTAGARPVVSVWSARSGWRTWYVGYKLAAAPLRRYSVTLPAIPLGVTAVSVGVAFDATSTVVLDDPRSGS